ncbi:hypothetical protein LSUE1_G001732 [Lachnellula suecica]|uniref:Small secreted protein n=1 Tax=Lachnellula suecica TaxID=602035 RepID=A0A8T9CMI8_9HELO|nr:hypothetical protein LSUE1_G001732 [Lachnellula suecica]
MKFSAALIAMVATLAIAAPTGTQVKRAAVLGTKTYDEYTDAFNKAIATATGDAKTALQNGKIQNKVLKLTATSLELQIKAAQGEDTAAKLAAETKKLDNNIALDKAAAGQAATKLSFTASIS